LLDSTASEVLTQTLDVYGFKSAELDNQIAYIFNSGVGSRSYATTSAGFEPQALIPPWNSNLRQAAGLSVVALLDSETETRNSPTQVAVGAPGGHLVTVLNGLQGGTSASLSEPVGNSLVLAGQAQYRKNGSLIQLVTNSFLTVDPLGTSTTPGSCASGAAGEAGASGTEPEAAGSGGSGAANEAGATGTEPETAGEPNQAGAPSGNAGESPGAAGTSGKASHSPGDAPGGAADEPTTNPADGDCSCSVPGAPERASWHWLSPLALALARLGQALNRRRRCRRSAAFRRGRS
jgi:hypothetical protein